MKRIHTSIILIFSLPVLLTLPAHAETYSYNGGEDNLGALYDALPPELQSEMGALAEGDPAKTAEELTEKLDITYWVGKIAEGVTDSLLPSLGTAASVVGILLLLASFRLLSENITDGSLAEPLEFCGNLCTASVVLGAAEGMVGAASACLQRLCGIINVILPVSEAVCIAEGSLTELTVHRSAMLLYIGVTSNLNQLVLKPLFGVLFGFAAVTSLCGSFGLSGFIGGIRKWVMIVISIFTMLFSFVLSLQTVLARSADSLALKTVRLAIGSFVPIVGGTLSEALTTVKEGMGALRSITGVGGVVIVLLLVLPTAITLFSGDLVLSFCHMAAEILGLGASAAMIGEVKSVLSILSAIVYATSLLFILAMFLFAKMGAGG